MIDVRPILGFGRAGWFLLPIALGLLILYLAGFDPHLRVLHFVKDNFGADAMMEFSWRFYYPLDPENFLRRVPLPGLGIFQVCVLLIALHNGRLRAECLNENWFLSLDDARRKVKDWRRHYNEDRPHSALGNLAPGEFAASSGQASLAG